MPVSYGHSDELGPQRLVIAWSGNKPSDEATEALAGENWFKFFRQEQA